MKLTWEQNSHDDYPVSLDGTVTRSFIQIDYNTKNMTIFPCTFEYELIKNLDYNEFIACETEKEVYNHPVVKKALLLRAIKELI